jgi:Protein of unknown function (DUF1326)
LSAGCRPFLSKDISSALKGGVKLCQRKFVNEVLRALVTKLALNGFCESVLFWHIRRGHYGDINLDGLSFVRVGRWEGDLWAGKAKNHSSFRFEPHHRRDRRGYTPPPACFCASAKVPIIELAAAKATQQISRRCGAMAGLPIAASIFASEIVHALGRGERPHTAPAIALSVEPLGARQGRRERRLGAFLGPLH